MLIRVEHTTSYSLFRAAARQHAISAHDAALRPHPSRRELEALLSRRGHHAVAGSVRQSLPHLDGGEAGRPSSRSRCAGLVRTRDTNGVVGMAPAELPAGLYLRETPYTVVSPSIRDFASRFETKLGARCHRDLARDHARHRRGGRVQPRRDPCAHHRRRGVGAGERRLPGPCAYLLRRLPRASAFRPAMSAAILPRASATRRMPRAMPGPRPMSIISAGSASIPPIGTSATEAYIRTAIGLDYAEASPMRGVRSGGGTETMTVRVSFPSQQQQAMKPSEEIGRTL